MQLRLLIGNFEPSDAAYYGCSRLHTKVRNKKRIRLSWCLSIFRVTAEKFPNTPRTMSQEMRVGAELMGNGWTHSNKKFPRKHVACRWCAPLRNWVKKYFPLPHPTQVSTQHEINTFRVEKIAIKGNWHSQSSTQCVYSGNCQSFMSQSWRVNGCLVAETFSN